MAEDTNLSPPRKSPWMRPWLLLLLAVAGALCLFFGVTGSRIVRAAAEAPADKAGVITTGGSAQDPDFSEGGVGRDYLLRRGIPEQALIAETQGSDTAQSAARVANIMRTNGMRSCVAVSDAYHVFRIRALLEKEGVQVELAPRPESRPHPLWERFAAVMREAASYLAWKAGLP